MNRNPIKEFCFVKINHILAENISEDLCTVYIILLYYKWVINYNISKVILILYKWTTFLSYHSRFKICSYLMRKIVEVLCYNTGYVRSFER